MGGGDVQALRLALPRLVHVDGGEALWRAGKEGRKLLCTSEQGQAHQLRLSMVYGGKRLAGAARKPGTSNQWQHRRKSDPQDNSGSAAASRHTGHWWQRRGKPEEHLDVEPGAEGGVVYMLAPHRQEWHNTLHHRKQCRSAEAIVGVASQHVMAGEQGSITHCWRRACTSSRPAQ